MRKLLPRLLLYAVCLSTILTPQGQPELAAARAIDREIRQLERFPDRARGDAIKRLASAIQDQPLRYALPLAFNLDVDGREGSDFDSLQLITKTLGDLLRRLPPGNINHTDSFQILAELIRYEHTTYESDDPRLKAAMVKLQGNDEVRAASDFALHDLHGKEWSMKRLRGRVVLVNFWATWCPSCQRETAELDAVYKRFRSRGLLVLAISNENARTQRRFFRKYRVSYPMLVDFNDQIRQRFRVDGIPMSLVYNRGGVLVSQSLGRPSAGGFREMLGSAGLR